MSEDVLKSLLEGFNVKLSRELDRLIEGTPSELQKFLRYYFDQGGKRVRPLLTYLITDAVGGDTEQAIPTATILELLHTFSLYHDDIVDEAELRRGAMTAYKKWGMEITLIGGDIFHALIHGYYAKLVKERRIDPNIAFECIYEIVYNAEVPTGWASIKEIEYARSPEVPSFEDALWVTENKTAPIFAVGAKLGALIGGASRDVMDHMEKFGKHLGLSFQLIDDILDITGTKTKEKDVGGDFREHKKTPLLVKAYQKDPKFVQHLLTTKEPIDQLVNEFIQRFSDEIQSIKELAMYHANEALKHLNVLPESKSKTMIIEIMNLLKNRTY